MMFKFREPDARRLRVEVPAKLTNRDALFDVLATGLPLPPHFGRNWDALQDCLTDLDFVSADIVELVHADLPGLPPTDLLVYLEILEDAVEQANARGGAPELDVIFPCDARAAVQRVLAND